MDLNDTSKHVRNVSEQSSETSSIDEQLLNDTCELEQGFVDNAVQTVQQRRQLRRRLLNTLVLIGHILLRLLCSSSHSSTREQESKNEHTD